MTQSGDERDPDRSRSEESWTGMLARRARAGERERFDELCERVMPALCGWAWLRVAPELRSRIEPEELVQETWLRALFKFDDYDDSRGSFRSWIFGIAKNVLLESFRNTRSPQADSRGPTKDRLAIEDVADTATSATQRVSRSDAVRHFLEGALALDRDDQLLMILCGLEGLTCGEAAVRLNVSEEAARKRWQRLRAAIVARGAAGSLLAY